MRFLIILLGRKGAYVKQYGQLVNVTPWYEIGAWGFELMIDQKDFTSIPNSLEIGRKLLPPPHRDKEETSLWEVWRDWPPRPFLSKEESLWGPACPIPLELKLLSAQRGSQRTLKLTFPMNIEGLAVDVHIKGQWAKQSVCSPRQCLRQTVYRIRSDNGTLFS